MAVLLIQGFENLSVLGWPASGSYNIQTLYLNGFTGGNFSIGYGSTAGPWSRGAYNPGVSNEYLTLRNQSATRVFGAFRCYFSSYGRGLLGMYSTSDWDFRINVDGNGFVQLQGQSLSTTIGTGTNLLYLNAWNLIEYDITLGDAGACKVWVHGLTTPDIDTTGDTKHSTETAFKKLALSGNSGVAFDDIIVYDDTGSRWKERVGDKVVVGLFPNAKGDQENWDPKKTATASRFYFPMSVRGYSYLGGGTSGWRSGAPAPVEPAYAALWDYTVPSESDPISRGRLSPEKFDNTAESANQLTYSRPAYDVSGSPPWDMLMGQYVSPALAAQTITGTFKMYGCVIEETAADNVSSQVVIRVVSNDGQTVRGTLYAGDTDTTNPPSNEWSDSVYTSRAFPRGNTGSGQALTDIGAISEGDRLVVEYGVRMRGPVRNSVQLGMYLGSEGASDLPENETETDQTKNAWIQFSNALTLSDDGNWDHTNETPPYLDALYVETNVDNDLDLYHLDPVPAAYTVDGPLVVKMVAKKSDPGARTLTHAYKTSGATQTGAATGLPTGSYGITFTYLDEDATGPAAWDDTKVNSLQIGPKATT